MKAHVFATITKVDTVRREVSGILTEEVTDKAKEKMDYAKSKPYFQKWSDGISKATGGKSLGNVREMHQAKAVGKFTEIVFDDDAKQIFVTAKIVDDQCWEKCEAGVFTGFSIGGNVVGKMVDDPDEPGVKRYTVDPVEGSVVDNPCLGTAHFTAVKADGVTEERSFKVWEPSAEAVAEEAGKIALTKGGSYSDHMAEAKTALIAAKSAEVGGVEGEAPETEPVADVKEAAAAPEPAPTDWNINQVFRCEVDGSIHATKAAAKDHVTALKTLEANGSPLAKAIADALAKASGEKPKGDYGDVKYADPGYQSDKKPRYPLDTASHIRAAWSYINQAKNASLYADEDVAKIKAAIIDAWKEKIDPSGPPSAEKMALLDNKSAFKLLSELTAARVTKGLYTVSWLSTLLAEMGYMLQSVVWEESNEHDTDSKLPQMAMDAFTALRTLLVEMISEETAEQIQDILSGNAIDDIALLEPGGDSVILELAASAVTLVKADTALMEKAGRRNSGKDQKHIQDAHDSAVKAGATCSADNVDKDAAATLVKVEGERDLLKRQMEEALPDIQKLGEAVTSMKAALDTANAKIAKLEAEPAPMPKIPRGAGTKEKGMPLSELSAGDLAQAVTAAIKNMTPAQLQDLSLSAALSNPRPAIMRGGAGDE